MALTVDGCIGDLIGLGYEFILRDDRSVTVKQPAKRNPRAAEMMNYLSYHKAEVRAAVRDWGQRSILPEPAVNGTDVDVPTGVEEDRRVINEPLDKPEGLDQIRAPTGVAFPEPDAGGWIVLEGVSPEVAFAAGRLIKAGKAELIGMVIYRRRSNVFDLTFKMLEVKS